MKSFSELKTAVANSKSPEHAAGTFVDGTIGLFDQYSNDPVAIKSLGSDIRNWRTSGNLISVLTGNKS